MCTQVLQQPALYGRENEQWSRVKQQSGRENSVTGLTIEGRPPITSHVLCLLGLRAVLIHYCNGSFYHSGDSVWDDGVVRYPENLVVR